MNGPSEPSDAMIGRRSHVMTMTWARLCFLHWPIPAETLRPFIPPELEVDTFEGQAWLGVVPFEMQAVRLRFLPPFPTTHRFAELNLRTYVRHRSPEHQDAGVWFFSLDAESQLSVMGARATFSLPYMNARMQMGEPETESGWIDYRSERTHRGEPPARFDGRYRPTGPAAVSQPGTLEHFLTERYSLFAQAGYGVPKKRILGGQRNRLMQGRIEHAQWPLQPAEAELERCDMFRVIGMDGPPLDRPLAHYAESIPVCAFRPLPVNRSEAP